MLHKALRQHNKLVPWFYTSYLSFLAMSGCLTSGLTWLGIAKQSHNWMDLPCIMPSQICGCASWVVSLDRCALRSRLVGVCMVGGAQVQDQRVSYSGRCCGLLCWIFNQYRQVILKVNWLERKKWFRSFSTSVCGTLWETLLRDSFLTSHENRML